MRIYFENSKGVYSPVVTGEVVLETYKSGRAGTLRFNCVIDKYLNISEGDAVSLVVDDINIFYGFVFEKSQNSPDTLSILCYDQLRYLKNRTSIVYSNKKYSDLLRQMANEFKLKTGTIEDSGHIILGRVEEGTGFDILARGYKETLEMTGEELILFDDFGKLSLKKASSMFIPLALNEKNIQNYSYVTSIDNDVYTRVKYSKDDSKSGKREMIVAEDKNSQEKWGVLELYESKNQLEIAEIRAMASSVLKQKNRLNVSLFVTTSFGDVRVRAGSSLVLDLKLNDTQIRHVMMVESVTHSIEGSSHFMGMQLSTLEEWEGEIIDSTN